MFIMPMPLKLHDAPFDDEEYIFEPSLQGYRLIYSQHDRITTLYTRSGQNVIALYPELYHNGIDEDIVLDGEVALVNPKTGHIDFASIEERGCYETLEKYGGDRNILPSI